MGLLWPGVVVPVGVLLVGLKDQNMNLKEKMSLRRKSEFIYKKNGYKSYKIHICKPDLALNNP